MAELTFDGDPEEHPLTCAGCGYEHVSRTGFVLRDGNAHAIYFADWHEPMGEAYLDVVLGSFLEPSYEDNVTFGCRIGHVPGQDELACSLTTGGATRSENPLFGAKLDRTSALAHPWLGAFWTVVDWLVVNDALLREKVFHGSPHQP